MSTYACRLNAGLEDAVTLRLILYVYVIIRFRCGIGESQQRQGIYVHLEPILSCPSTMESESYKKWKSWERRIGGQ